MLQASLLLFLPGQEDGNSIAKVLFGDHSPSGKLPITFPVSDKQTPLRSPSQYPGINDQADYSEGLFMGYRWYDFMNIAPLFPFGHGLSYTTFKYSNLTVTSSTLTITMTITNVGDVVGSETVQLYIGFPRSTGEPLSVLRGFDSVSKLIPGRSRLVRFQLTKDDLSIFDVTMQNWKFIHGTFFLFIGSSSRDIRLIGALNV